MFNIVTLPLESGIDVNLVEEFQVDFTLYISGTIPKSAYVLVNIGYNNQAQIKKLK